MDEPFELPVVYKGKKIMLPAQFMYFGYTHKFKVEANGIDVFYEPDEEGNYRAMINAEEVSNQKLEIELLKTIAEAIKKVIS